MNDHSLHYILDQPDPTPSKPVKFIPEGFALANNRQVTNKCKSPKGLDRDSELFKAKKILLLGSAFSLKIINRIASYYTKMMIKSSYIR